MTLRRQRLDFDEEDVRIRPGRGSRPRTRRRPAHEDAVPGFVTQVDRGRYACLVGDHRVVAMRARELGRRGVVVGDRVRLVGDVSGHPDALARIVRLEPRSTTLRRTADDTDPEERVIVAGADQLVIVTALADPPPRARLIDRCLVAAYDAGLDPLLCLTKSDLASPEGLVKMYAPLGVPYVVTRKDEIGPEDGPAWGELHARLRDRISVLVGHSGVGKSTLVNALIPEAERAVREVNPVTGRGRHTSSSAIALRLASDGWIIDTPGVRSFGLAHVRPADLLAAFPDLAAGAEHCPRGCSHLPAGDAPQMRCALDDWVADGHADVSRLDSLRRLLSARERHDDD